MFVRFLVEKSVECVTCLKQTFISLLNWKKILPLHNSYSFGLRTSNVEFQNVENNIYSQELEPQSIVAAFFIGMFMKKKERKMYERKLLYLKL